MSRVFIPYEPVRRNAGTGNTERLFDLTPAAVYGELTFLMEHGNLVLSPAPMVQQLRRALKDFSDDDYILPVGDPVAIGLVTAIAAQVNHGRVNLLRWDRSARNYITITARI